jgi:hypothetical protein
MSLRRRLRFQLDALSRGRFLPLDPAISRPNREKSALAYQELAKAVSLLWTIRYNPVEEEISYRIEQAKDSLLRQQQEGLWLGEQCAPNPLGNAWVSAGVTVRTALAEFPDAALYELSDWFFRGLYGLCSWCSHPKNGAVWMPGTCWPARPLPSGYPPPHSMLTAWWRETKGLPHLGELATYNETKARKDFTFEATPLLRQDKLDAPYWSALRMIRDLRERGDTFGGGAETLPHLKLPMTVYRWETGYLAVVPKLTSAKLTDASEAKLTIPVSSAPGSLYVFSSWVLLDLGFVPLRDSRGVGLAFDRGGVVPPPLGEVPRGARTIRSEVLARNQAGSGLRF